MEVQIRQYNRVAILGYPLAHRVEMIEGSSVEPATFEEVNRRIEDGQKVLVTLDSDHAYEHVRKEQKGASWRRKIGPPSGPFLLSR